MTIVILMVVVGVIIAGGLAVYALRSVGLEDARTEQRLHQPDAHTLAYAVPNGQDPVVLTAALRRAGMASVVDMSREGERILVECDEHERSRVREVIEHAGVPGYDGHTAPPTRIVFEDER